MIDSKAYAKAMGFESHEGQELILGEVVGLLAGCERVWVPFPDLCRTLISRLIMLDVEMCFAPYTASPDAEAVYFGTPTIVNGKPLFASSAYAAWDKWTERTSVRVITSTAQDHGLRRIVSGLGSGDIKVDERLHDMGGGEIACLKRFDGFEDHVLVREL